MPAARRVGSRRAARMRARYVLGLLACASTVVDGRRTCLSTRRTARLGCSPKCKAERADRHCQACICATCSFCNTVSSSTALHTTRNYRVPGGGDDGENKQHSETSAKDSSSSISISSSSSSSSSSGVDNSNRHSKSRLGSRRNGRGSSRRNGRGSGRIRNGGSGSGDTSTSSGVSSSSGASSAGMKLVQTFSLSNAIAQITGGALAAAPAPAMAMRKRRRGVRARHGPASVTVSAAQLGSTRRWVAAQQQPDVLESFLHNRTVVSVILRTLGYVPGPQLPLEFGGHIGDYTLAGAKMNEIEPLLSAEIAAAGPVPRSVRDQRILARRAARKGSKPQKVDWHASPVAGLLPGRQARPPTPKARAKRRRKQLLGEVEIGGALVGAENLTLRSTPAGAVGRKRQPNKAKRHGKGSPHQNMTAITKAKRKQHRQAKRGIAAIRTPLRFPRNASDSPSSSVSLRKKRKHPGMGAKPQARPRRSVEGGERDDVDAVASTHSKARRKRPPAKLAKRHRDVRMPSEATPEQTDGDGDGQSRRKSTTHKKKKKRNEKNEKKAKGAKASAEDTSSQLSKSFKKKKKKSIGSKKRRKQGPSAVAPEGEVGDGAASVLKQAARRARLRGSTAADRFKSDED